MKDVNENSDIYKIRHSLAHILAQAVKRLYPDVKLGIGPAIENGFYYDFLFKEPIKEEDLERIYNEMLEILKVDTDFVQTTLPKNEAIIMLHNLNQPFKAEIANDIEGDEVSFYTNGDFTDLCKGPHVSNTREINPEAFKLTHIAGAYWKGDEHREMMQRIYGVAFETKEELERYLLLQEEIKKRDHRVIGKNLGLFVTSDLVGSGLPLFAPRGAYMRRQLLQLSEELQRKKGFEEVSIPHIAKKTLYEVSGHWEKYQEHIMRVYISQASTEEFAIKPMNCPHHIQIFSSQKRSYKDLPIRYMESTTCYRDEKSGELLGLARVRSLTQDDAHIFCRYDQIKEELKNVLEMIREFYGILNLPFKVRISSRDEKNEKHKYLGDDEDWKNAEEFLIEIVKELNLPYFIAHGEAAFYGPKIDVIVTDVLGREWQCATQQLDFVLPKRFNLTYTDKDGKEKPVVMIHKAILGSVERFMAIYIEHTAGNLPLWLSYYKAIVIPVSNKEKYIRYAFQVAQLLNNNLLRTIVDDSDDTLNNKIRKAQLDKFPYILVVGDKEIDSEVVSVRLRNGTILGLMTVDELLERMLDEEKSRK